MISQILAVAIFVIMFLIIISEKIERHIVTLVSALLTLVLVFGVSMRDFGAIIETLNFGALFSLISGIQAVKQRLLQAVSTGKQLFLFLV